MSVVFTGKLQVYLEKRRKRQAAALKRSRDMLSDIQNMVVDIDPEAPTAEYDDTGRLIVVAAKRNWEATLSYLDGKAADGNVTVSVNGGKYRVAESADTAVDTLIELLDEADKI